MSDLEYLFNAITTDFTAFCSLVELPQREWHKSPIESTITTRPLILSNKQRELIEFINTHTETVIVKARQRGYTTLLSMWLLWLIMYTEEENVLYTHRTEKSAKALWLSLRTIYDQIPELLRMPLKFTPGTISITNEQLNSKMSILTATEDTGRGHTYTRAVVDELSSYKPSIQDSLMAALSSACPTNKIFVSTPRQENDLFHRKVTEAEHTNTLFINTFWEDAAEWFGSPENAIEWRNELEKSQTKAQIARELDCTFKGAVENTVWELPDTAYVDLDPVYVNRLRQSQLISLDLGFSPDSTFVLFAGIDKGVLYVYDELEVKQQTISQIVDTIKSRGGRNILGVCDSSSKAVDLTSGASSHLLLSKSLGCRFATRKTDRVTMLNLAHHLLFQGKVKISNRCYGLIEMFNNFELVNGKIPDSRQSSGLKHAHDAFAYLIYNINASLSTQQSIILGRDAPRRF